MDVPQSPAALAVPTGLIRSRFCDQVRHRGHRGV